MAAADVRLATQNLGLAKQQSSDLAFRWIYLVPVKDSLYSVRRSP
jgi:hypothetical protein